MPTKKIQTQIHSGQYDTIKELLVEDSMLDIIDSFIDSFSTVNQQIQQENIYLCFLGENFFEFIQTITPSGSSAHLGVTHLSQLWSGEINLQTTYGRDTPSLPVLRVALLQAIIDTLHKKFPERRHSQPILEPFPALNGMPRIRELFKQYISKTTPGSLERYKLALEILLEKENLGLPSTIVSEADITLTTGFAPGDFSHLDLSDLDLRRHDGQNGGFQGLVLHHSNCDGTNWSGLSLLGTDFTGSSLRGADLSNLSSNEDIMLSQTDIEGSYFGEDYIVDRRAKNYTKISQSAEQLVLFQSQLQQKIAAEKLREQIAREETLAKTRAEALAQARAETVETLSFNSFKKSYFIDYNSSFFKNPNSTMKSMLDHDLIHNTKEISQYANEHPNSRTARVLASMPLVTVDDAIALEPPLVTCQTY